jgi:hypothetical protein
VPVEQASPPRARAPRWRPPAAKRRHSGGKQCSQAREERRRWLRVYRRQVWPRRLEYSRGVGLAERPDGEWVEVQRYPVPRRAHIPLKLVKEVAEANIGVRGMREAADELAAEALPDRFLERWRARFRHRRQAPDATPELDAAVARLYGRRETQKMAQALGQRAMQKRERERRSLAKRLFRRGG